MNPSDAPGGSMGLGTSPMGTPGPAPLPLSPPISLTRAAFGPVLLIVIGLLFVIEYAGGPRVGQTWPALIITAGLLKLAEYMRNREV